MKRKSMAFCLAFCMLFCVGCSTEDTGSDSDTEESTTVEIPEGALVDESGEFYYTGNVKQIGDDNHGYLQIPSTYVAVSGSSSASSDVLQYCDTTGTNIITLTHYESVDYETAAFSMYYTLMEEEDDGTLEGLSGAEVTINGCNAKQVYCHYLSDNMFLVAWMIEDPENSDNSYYLSFEFEGTESGIVACSSTFMTVEQYAESLLTDNEDE